MKRRIFSILGCLTLAFAFVALAPVAGAHALATSSITGVVVNGTHQNAHITGQKVILQRTDGNSTQDIATTVADGSGRFAFSNLPIDANAMYAAYTTFQSGLFSSQAVKLDSGTPAALQLTVYDTTNDDANLRVSVATLLVRQPRPVNGLIGIGEIVTIENTGATAFVGTLTGDASKPMRLLRFATPPNASDLSLGIGFDGSQVVTTDKGFGSTATVPPGTTDFAFSIDIPYTGTAADLSFKPVYSATRVVVLVPLDMFVDGRDFAAQGVIESLGSRYQVFTVGNVAADKQDSLRLTGLPEAGEKSYLDVRALTIFATILALLALAALLLYLRRGNIVTALGLIPATTPTGDGAVALLSNESDKFEAGEQQRLLDELLSLERAHTAGKLTEPEFRQRDRAIRQQLRAILASERPSVVAIADTSGAAATERAASAAEEPCEQAGDETREEAAPEQSKSSGGRR
ncbi:MAG TPA: carboxypeptidase-like regulatory domain-containing protein [Ktedonobacterales bacterium]|nr:carboxypeptidase-like regulatory domain-containing protein [Ktedonobacterales bacterium]